MLSADGRMNDWLSYAKNNAAADVGNKMADDAITMPVKSFSSVDSY